MMEAISYMAGAELPVVIVNIMRAGPGLGGILPSQADYFQATKGGGHGDYRLPRAGAVVGAGGGRPGAGRLRPRRLLPQPGDGPRRRPDRPDDGAGRVQRRPRSRASRSRPRPGRRPAATARGRPTSSTRCSSTPRCSSGTTSSSRRSTTAMVRDEVRVAEYGTDERRTTCSSSPTAPSRGCARPPSRTCASRA